MNRLLQIAVEANTGSTGIIAESIGNIVMEKGWESHVAYGRYAQPSKSKIFRIGNDLDNKLHALATRIFDRHGMESKSATRNLIKDIIRINPSIIHLHHLHGYYVNIEILFSFLKESHIPVVWTFHDCWSITGHCSYFDSIGCDKWKTQCYECPQKMEYPQSLGFDRSRKNYDEKRRIFNSVENLTIVSVSKWLDSVVSQSFLKGLNRQVIYNGVDIDLFSPSPVNETLKTKMNLEGKFVILGLATTWSPRKGLDDFIELSGRIREDFIIVLVGLSTDQISDLPRNIIGLSRTENREELRDLYNIADVFVNLSVEETFGLTTAEALSCGTPVVVYNATASPELVSETTGYVVEKNDIDGVLDAINTIKSVGKESYSIECRNRAVTLFDQKARFSEYYNLYNQLLQKQL